MKPVSKEHGTHIANLINGILCARLMQEATLEDYKTGGSFKEYNENWEHWCRKEEDAKIELRELGVPVI